MPDMGLEKRQIVKESVEARLDDSLFQFLTQIVAHNGSPTHLGGGIEEFLGQFVDEDGERISQLEISLRNWRNSGYPIKQKTTEKSSDKTRLALLLEE